MDAFTPIGESPIYPSKVMSKGHRTVPTYINSGRHHNVDEDGIFMTSEFEQDSGNEYTKLKHSRQGVDMGV